MGDVIQFRDFRSREERMELKRRSDLIRHAKEGGPTLDHSNAKPVDWWNGDGTA